MSANRVAGHVTKFAILSPRGSLSRLLYRFTRVKQDSKIWVSQTIVREGVGKKIICLYSSTVRK